MRKRTLAVRIRFTRSEAARLLVLALLVGVPEFLLSQTSDTSRSVQFNMQIYTNPVGAFSRLVIPGNAVLARDGGAVTVGNVGATASVPAGFFMSGRGVFGQAIDVSAGRYNNSINLVPDQAATPAFQPGLVIKNPAGGKSWLIYAKTATAPRERLWLSTINSGAVSDKLAWDDQGRLLLARWSGSCNASEFAIFSGDVGPAGMSGDGDVQQICNYTGGCNVSVGGGRKQLCVPFRSW